VGAEPYFQDPSGAIWCGDAFAFLAGMSDDSVDLTLTDPPYNEVNRETSGLRSLDKGEADSASVDLVALASELDRVTRGSVYVWCGYEQASPLVVEFNRLGRATRVGVWHKTNPSPMNGEKFWLSGVELCVFAHGPKAYFDRACQAPVWKGPSRRTTVHPTEKPLWLMQELVQASCAPGGVVFDPFLGSGATAEAAVLNGRRFLGVEMNPEYCDLAVGRLAQQTLALA
jgi:DNA modification methylase